MYIFMQSLTVYFSLQVNYRPNGVTALPVFILGAAVVMNNSFKTSEFCKSDFCNIIGLGKLELYHLRVFLPESFVTVLLHNTRPCTSTVLEH
jgi:hypothetical protein